MMKTRYSGHWPVGTPWWAEKWRQKVSEHSDWDNLSPEQQESVNAWRNRMGDMLTAETKTFEHEHPEMRLNWSFGADPLLRANNLLTLEEL